ncbi:Hypothetical predicted protein [Podarcis lilfordi]|nr:Hypothetical predicted protein [Podarcis lilfordi]
MAAVWLRPGEGHPQWDCCIVLVGVRERGSVKGVLLAWPVTITGNKDDLLQLVEQLHPDNSNEWISIKLERDVSVSFLLRQSEQMSLWMHLDVCNEHCGWHAPVFWIPMHRTP